MSNKTVVITGGTRGIGLDITEAFVSAGYFAIVGARKEGGINNRFGELVKYIECDAKEESAHQKLVDTAISRTGSLDVYVNNVGYSEWRPIENIDAKFLDEIFQTNVQSIFWGCKAASAVMRDNGTIINISSIAGKRGSANNSAYCATKFGVNGITQALAKELGPKGIRVNALCPVIIPTPGLMEALNSPFSPADGDPNLFISNFKRTNSALGRLPTGQEVGEFCLFLASKAASAVTGQCINVDCGVFPQ
jgi:3-oxoacyl-[acyl-carrier protein] reductase/meso-butanediol dehydrogenase/(S,S)-butanediol dehydrogenase/diacetyl reductase